MASVRTAGPTGDGRGCNQSRALELGKGYPPYILSHYAIYEDRWKLLDDLDADEGELCDRAGDEPQREERMGHDLERLRKDVFPPLAAPSARIQEETSPRLEALGYVQ